MITKTDTQLAKILIERKIVTPEALQPIAEEAGKSRESLFHLLVQKGTASEEKLLPALAEALKVPLVQGDALKMQPGVAEKVPLKIAEYYKMAPLKIEKRKLVAAVSAPLDLRSLDDIRAHLGLELEIVLARESDVVEAIKRSYGFAAGTIGEIVAHASQSTQAAEPAYEKIENIEQLAGDASIAKLVNQIILEAYHKRATDIHIEPFRGKVKLRYRIDGILYNANVQAEISRLILPILSRIKIMSNLNIVERRLPQDGRAIVKVEDTQLDLRVSSIPTPYGESVVIRLLPMNRVFKLEQLGLDPQQIETFTQLIDKPHGIIFITGPTGSGKSTTLYACLNRINTDERKIITIEDPVEYEMEGVTQIQVVPNIGLDFAKGLRSMLRHDPDVIMVGEVRDLETAEMAIRVALTGHLVFSTLHTNDAASGITRLVDIGIQPYLVASSVEAFIAQRLVRKVCPECKEEDPSVGEELKKQIAGEMGMRKWDFPVYHGRGCAACNQTGFWGRLAVYEILLMNEAIQQLVMRRAPASDVKREAVFQGMKTLRQDGWRKVILGLTTPAEVLEASQGDGEGETPAVPPPQAEALSRAPRVPSAVKRPTETPPVEAAPADPDAAQKEGRVFARAEHNIQVHYHILRPPAGVAPAKARVGAKELSFTKNISAGGLAFISKEPVLPGTMLEIQLELPQESGAVECLAKAVHQKEAEGGYAVGVCFLDLSTAMRAKLDRFVSKDNRKR